MSCGRDLLAALQQRNTPDAPLAIAHRFGAISLAVIIARITRGLMLATAMHRRVIRTRRYIDAPETIPSRPPGSSPSGPRPRAPARLVEEDPVEQGKLPSAREIAERIRRRPLGAVIVDICQDLGIDSHHALWGAVLAAITCHGGDRRKLLDAMQRRHARATELGLPPLPSWEDASAAPAGHPMLAEPEPPLVVRPMRGLLLRAQRAHGRPRHVQPGFAPPALATPPP